MIVQMSSGVTALQRCSHWASSRPSPRCASSLIEIASSAVPSIIRMCFSFGREPRTARTFSSCASSSTITATASEFSSTYWHSSGELVW